MLQMLVVLGSMLLGLAEQAAAPQSPAPPATDIYLIPLTAGLASMKEAKPVPVSTASGYDNQPAFSADGARILFAANRDGKQIDIYAFDRAANRVTRLTQTAENENSPTFVPSGIGDGGGGFSVVRTEPDKTQRLWRFDASGGNPQIVLTDVKPVGYHAWVDASTVALFVLGPPATLRIADVKTGRAEIAAEGIGRSLHRVPGTRTVSFVQREAAGEFWIKQIDVDSKKIEAIVKTPDVEGSTDRDMAWTPDGKTILLSSGSKVVAWTRGAAEWNELFDPAAHGLGTPSRIAVSPNGDAVAIVVSESKK
jgi:Tol biopolymer transport system component